MVGGRVTCTPLVRLGAAEVDAWRALAAAAAEPNPFLEADLVLASSRALATPAVSLLSVHDDDGLVLALPVVPATLVPGVPLRALAVWEHDYCFLGTPLVRAGAEAAAWFALLGGLAARPPGPALLLSLLPQDGAVRRGLDQALRSHPLRAQTHHVLERAVARRAPDGSVAASPARGVHLKGLRRQRRRLGEALGGTVELVDRTGDPEALRAFLALEAAGWKGRSGTALAVRGRDADLLTTLPASWRDRVRLLCLQVDGRVVAAQVDLRAGDAEFCFKTAYDERLREFSPGALLEVEVLAAFRADPQVALLDSCAVQGHQMAERLFPDRRGLSTVLVPLTRAGSAVGSWRPPLRAARAWARERRPARS